MSRVSPHHTLLHQAALLEREGRVAQALACYRQVTRIEAKNGAAHLGMARLLAQANQHEKALPHAKKAVRALPKRHDAALLLGNIYLGLNHATRALSAYREAQRLNQNDAEPVAATGRVWLQEGEADKALDHFRRAFALDPLNGRVYFYLAQCKKFAAADDNDLALMHTAQCAAELMAPGYRADLFFALGKAYDDLGQADRAFAYFTEANALVAQGQTDTVPAMRAHGQACLAAFSQDLLFERDDVGLDDAAPVFIVGMPRSGTTLLNQMLSQHPELGSAGEYLGLHWQITALAGMTPPITDPAGLAAAPKEVLHRLARGYLDGAQQISGGRKPIIVNKTPGNFVYVGLIRWLFPRATIINLRRDPRAVGLSCFQANFARGSLPWAASLASIADKLNFYAETTAAWHAALPDTVMDVRYEDLVTEPQSVLTPLLARIGVAWDERVLSPQNNAAAIRTASVAQARQGVHRGSVARWQRYEPHLAPLAERLTGQTLAGYEAPGRSGDSAAAA